MEQTNIQKNIGIVLGVVIIIGVLFVNIFWGHQPDNTTSAPVVNTPSSSTINPTPVSKVPTITPTPVPTPVVSSTPSYTLAQVSAHANASSCWSAIGTGVYDLTSWINQHPGGARAILSICGKDGTAAFNAQHGGQSRPEQELKSFFIGNYKK